MGKKKKRAREGVNRREYEEGGIPEMLQVNGLRDDF